MHRTRYCTQGCGIWIRFHFLRLRIQLFITMRIRIQLYSQSRSRSTALRNGTGGLHLLAYIEPVQWYRVLHKHLFLLRYGNTLEQLPVHPNGTHLEVIQVHTATIRFVFIPVRVLRWILVNITFIITFVVVIPLTVSSDEDCERSTARRRRTNGWCEVNEGISGALADTPATIK